jgi:hypothetical protein
MSGKCPIVNAVSNDFISACGWVDSSSSYFGSFFVRQKVPIAEVPIADTCKFNMSMV